MGYDVRFIDYDVNGKPIVEKYGGGLNEASAVQYVQSPDKKVSVQKKIEDIDRTLDDNLVAADTVNAWVPQSYSAGNFVVYDAKVYECIVNCGSDILPTDTTHWRLVTLSSIKQNVNNLTTNLTNLTTKVNWTTWGEIENPNTHEWLKKQPVGFSSTFYWDQPEGNPIVDGTTPGWVLMIIRYGEANKDTNHEYWNVWASRAGGKEIWIYKGWPKKWYCILK